MPILIPLNYICDPCKRQKIDQIEQKKQTAIQNQLLEKQLKAVEDEDRRRKDESDRQERLEREKLRQFEEEREREKRRKEKEEEKEREREKEERYLYEKKQALEQLQKAKNEIFEMKEKIISKNKKINFVGFNYGDYKELNKLALINRKKSEGYYFDLDDLIETTIKIEKIDLVGFKINDKKWKHLIKYSGNNNIYYLFSNQNVIENIIFLEADEINDFENLITEIDNRISKKNEDLIKKENEKIKAEKLLLEADEKKRVNEEKERIKLENEKRDKINKENEIQGVLSAALKHNKKTKCLNKKLQILFEFYIDLDKDIIRDNNYFLEFFKSNPISSYVVDYQKDLQEIIATISKFGDPYQSLIYHLLIFEKTIFKKTKFLNKIIDKHNISMEQLNNFICDISPFIDLLPKTKKFINNYYLLNPSEVKIFSSLYIHSILDGGKFISSIFILSIIFSVLIFNSGAYAGFGFFGHLIIMPVVIFIRFKYKIKILPLILFFIIAFSFSIATHESKSSISESKRIENIK